MVTTTASVTRARVIDAIASMERELAQALSEFVQIPSVNPKYPGVIYDELFANVERLVAASGLPLHLERGWSESSASTMNRLGADDQAVLLEDAAQVEADDRLVLRDEDAQRGRPDAP